jgi:hypothetical protein
MSRLDNFVAFRQFSELGCAALTGKLLLSTQRRALAPAMARAQKALTQRQE